MKKLTPFVFASILSMSAMPLAAEVVTVQSEESTVEQAVAKININSADAETLTQLPGIGIGKASAIVEFREENGSFLTIEDIKEVKGIGDKLFAKLEALVSVN